MYEKDCICIYFNIIEALECSYQYELYIRLGLYLKFFIVARHLYFIFPFSYKNVVYIGTIRKLRINRFFSRYRTPFPLTGNVWNSVKCSLKC